MITTILKAQNNALSHWCLKILQWNITLMQKKGTANSLPFSKIQSVWIINRYQFFLEINIHCWGCLLPIFRNTLYILLAAVVPHMIKLGAVGSVCGHWAGLGQTLIAYKN